MATQKIDIVIPCFNDLESVLYLLKTTDDVFLNSYLQITYLVVDNGSSEKLGQSIISEYSGVNRIKVLRLEKNIGYGGAILYGFKNSDADITCEMDADSEDPPSDLLKMIELLLEKKVDIVYGVRVNRKVSIRLKFFYMLFYKIYSFLSDSSVPNNAGEFAAYNKCAINRIKLFSPIDDFVRGIRTIIGCSSEPYCYKRESRYIGETKFNFFSAFSLAVDGFLFNTKKPLRFFTILGSILFLMSGIILLINSSLLFMNHTFSTAFGSVLPNGLTQTSLIFYFLLLSIFVLLCIIGEYAMKILDFVRNRPAYIEGEHNEN